MLRGVSLALAERGLAVSVIARSAPRLDVLARASSTMFTGQIAPVPVDYRDNAALVAALQNAIRERGPIQIAVVWVKPVAPKAPATIARLVQGRYAHILANQQQNPALPNPRRTQFFADLPDVDYQEVILGYFRDEDTGETRWLTHDEIVGGVTRALESTAPRVIVGTADPWEARPAPPP